MLGRKKKEEFKSTYNLVFLYPGKEGKVQLTKAEWSFLQALSKKRNQSIDSITLILIRMAIYNLLDNINKNVSESEGC